MWEEAGSKTRGRARQARSLDALFHDLMQECRHSAPGARLSAKLRTALEKLPPDERRELVSRTADGCAPLFVCARRGNAEVAEYLIKVCSAPLEQRGVYEAADERALHRVTPLWCAAVAGKLQVLKVVAEAGAALDAGSDSGSTPVRSACFMSHEAVVRELVARGADIHKPNHNGGTCLINAVQSATLCAFLLANGADVNAKDLQHKTALHYACKEHRGETARLLLQHGADPTAPCRAGDDALRTAAQGGAAHIVSLLSAHAHYPASRLADAHELLGATQLDEFNDTGAALASWRRATAIRHTADGYIAKAGVASPCAALAGAVEWRSLAELEAARTDVDELRAQALLVVTRILGTKHKDTVYRIMYRGAAYADAYRYQKCIDLWSWALDIRLERDSLLYSDTWHTACALTRLMLDARAGRLERARRVPRFADVLRVHERVAAALPEARRALEVRPVYKKQAETFDRAMRCVTHLLYLLQDTAETAEEILQMRMSIRSLVLADPRSALTGDSLLHLVVSRLNVLRSTYFNDDPDRALPIFPSVRVVQLLTSLGASARACNQARSTPLHVAAIPYNHSVQLVGALLAAGAHLDQVNRFGDSALTLLLGRCSLQPLQHTTLTCLAARVLGKMVPPRPGELPTSLLPFLEMHRA